jgi:hypothetical protein
MWKLLGEEKLDHNFARVAVVLGFSHTLNPVHAQNREYRLMKSAVHRLLYSVASRAVVFW